MTWKKLFFKLTFHDIKKRSWCMALLFVIQFLVIPVSALLSIQNYQGYYGDDLNLLSEYRRMAEDLFERSIFDFGKITSILFLIVGAVIMAMTGFSYLNSKKKVDFTHSMPVKRETLFLSRYVTGILLYMVPLIVNVGIGLLAAFMVKACSAYVVKSALCFLLYHLVYFLLFYGTSILAVVLIGNFVVSFLGVVILCTYQTVMWVIVVNLKEYFFQTYMRIYQTFQVYDPIGLLIRQIMSFNTNFLTYDYRGDWVRVGTESYYSTGWEVCLTAFVIALALGVAALLLFRIRKSESAGKSLVFPKLEPVVKAVLLLPVGLIGGMVFYGIATGYRKLWYSFGAVIFFLLAALIIEIIFRQDFKSLLKHKISALAGAGLILVVTLCFWLDLLGFDNRIPKSSQIESVGISIPKVENQEGYYASDFDTPYYYYNSYQTFSMNVFFKSFFGGAGGEANAVLSSCSITGEGMEEVRELADYFVKNKMKFERVKMSDFSGAVELWIEDQKSTKPGEESYEQFVECQVVYRLKNGKKIYRAYRMPYGEEFLEVMEPVFANEEYRKNSDPIFQDEENYRYLSAQGNFVEKQIPIARSDKKEILECLKKDRDKLTFQDAWTQNKSGYFVMVNNLGSKQSGICYVHENYTNTLNWLKEHKADLDVGPGEIISGSIEYFREDGSYRQIQLEEDKEKEELIPYLVRSDFIAPSGQISVVYNMMAMIEYKVKQDDSRITVNGDVYSGAYSDVYSDDYTRMDSYYLKDVPPFIKEAIH